MTSSFLIFICLLIVIIIVNMKCILIVPQHKVFIIERLGKFYKLAPQGLNIIIPFIDRIKTKVNLNTHTLKIIAQPLITKDNQNASVETIISFNITDPVKATYEIISLEKGLEYVITTIIRDIVKEIKQVDIINSSEKIIEKLNEVLLDIENNWGLKISNIEIANLSSNSTSKDVQESVKNFNAIEEY